MLEPNILYDTFSIEPWHLDLLKSEITKVQTKVSKDFNVRM